MSDCPDIEFCYNDADTAENEIAELYSYTEGPEFQLNLKVSSLVGLMFVWRFWSTQGDAEVNTVLGKSVRRL